MDYTPEAAILRVVLREQWRFSCIAERFVAHPLPAHERPSTARSCLPSPCGMRCPMSGFMVMANPTRVPSGWRASALVTSFS